MSPRRGGRGDYSPRKEDRRERDYDRRGGRDRERDRSRSPDVRDREMKDRERDDDQDREREPEAVANGDEHKGTCQRWSTSQTWAYFPHRSTRRRPTSSAR